MKYPIMFYSILIILIASLSSFSNEINLETQTKSKPTKQAQQDTSILEKDVVALSKGKSYLYGLGVEKDLEKSFFWYKKSAEMGNSDAQYMLGMMYGGGEAVPMDKEQAFYWMKKSAEQGNAEAQDNLALMYLNAYTTLKDDEQAFYWFRFRLSF